MKQRTIYQLFTQFVSASLKTLALLVIALVINVALGFIAILTEALAVSYTFLSDDDPVLNTILFLMGIVVIIGSFSVVLRAKLAPTTADMRVVLFTGITGFACGITATLISYPPL